MPLTLRNGYDRMRATKAAMSALRISDGQNEMCAFIMSRACAYAPMTTKPTWPSDISLMRVTLRRLLTSRALMASRATTVIQYWLPPKIRGMKMTTTKIATQMSAL